MRYHTNNNLTEIFTQQHDLNALTSLEVQQQ